MVDISFFRHMWQRIQEDDVPALAAQLAYFFFRNSPPASPGVSVVDMKKFLSSGEHPTSIGR